MEEDEKILKKIGLDTAFFMKWFGYNTRHAWYKSPRKHKIKAAAAEIVRKAGEHLSK